ncbi:hypothetical protein QWZ16_21580 [Vibrio ostreicida]|uniref:DUF3265 domain-containing protein n=1 Tax=Vibrio ostreicida TaxID=526588 RepID=A0ABT8BZR1_9VIBR|nr:hypothetical protein [Vibrio ostreicida]MDN3612189.1 hypothetical protein [Vibrio ostreicida]
MRIFGKERAVYAQCSNKAIARCISLQCGCFEPLSLSIYNVKGSLVCPSPYGAFGITTLAFALA